MSLGMRLVVMMHSFVKLIPKPRTSFPLFTEQYSVASFPGSCVWAEHGNEARYSVASFPGSCVGGAWERD